MGENCTSTSIARLLGPTFHVGDFKEGETLSSVFIGEEGLSFETLEKVNQDS